MKNNLILLLTILLWIPGYSQTVDVEYLNPKFENSTANYKYLRMGTSSEYFAGFMHNISSNYYGDGDDFSILTYDNRDLTFRTGTGNVIFFPTSGGNIGVNLVQPEVKFHVHGESRNGIRISSSDNGSTAKNISIWQGTGAGVIDVLGTNKLYLGYDEPIDLLIGRNGGKVGVGTMTPLTNLHVSEGSSGVNAYNVAGLFIENSGSASNYFVFQTATVGGGKSFSITNAGNVGIGTTNPTEKLSVNGTIRAKEVKVETGWSDFVFEKDYRLKSLREVETFITENGHLPDIPDAKEVEENGVNVGEMESKLLQKIEELTLYVIEQNKRIEKLEEENSQLKNK